MSQLQPGEDIIEYLARHERKSMLRFLTCGSVDDGKSTLIGRLLYDTHMVYEDQLAALQSASLRHGTTGDDFDPALLTDGLKAEREQGITIDVAYRYFSTEKRKFIIADTPGHEQYTRNMVTGASNSDLAVILIDARKGVLTQTRRHAFLVSLLGLRRVIVAVNKMDLIDYDEARFEAIRSDFLSFAARLELSHIDFVPLSALKGENVVNQSAAMPWYQGATLMHLLESAPISSTVNLIDLRFPIQYVIRPDLNFRGFAGTVASGVLRVGDEVIALPSGRRAEITGLHGSDGPQEEAFAGQTPVVTLSEEIDLSRGDQLARPNNLPRRGRRFEAMVVWMSEAPMRPGGRYAIKHTTRLSAARLSAPQYQIDVNTLHRRAAEHLELNEIGRLSIESDEELFYDPYARNPKTGALIIIDPISHDTVGAAMILSHLEQETQEDYAGERALTGEGLGAPVNAEERRALIGDGLIMRAPRALAPRLEGALLRRGYFARFLADTAPSREALEPWRAAGAVLILSDEAEQLPGARSATLSAQGERFTLTIGAQEPLSFTGEEALLRALLAVLRGSEDTGRSP